MYDFDGQRVDYIKLFACIHFEYSSHSNHKGTSPYKSFLETVDFVPGFVFCRQDPDLGEELVDVLGVAGQVSPVALEQHVSELFGCELEHLKYV